MLLARSMALRRWRPSARLSSSAASTRLKLLVVDAYDRAGRERLAQVGCSKASDLFALVLREVDLPDGYEVDIEVIHPADGEVEVSRRHSTSGTLLGHRVAGAVPIESLVLPMPLPPPLFAG